MARVKRAVHADKKRRVVLERASGYRGQRSRLYRKAKEQLLHSFTYTLRDRKARKGDFRKLDPAHQRRRPRRRHHLQPLHPGSAPGRHRAGPPRPRRAGRLRSRDLQGHRRAGQGRSAQDVNAPVEAEPRTSADAPSRASATACNPALCGVLAYHAGTCRYASLPHAYRVLAYDGAPCTTDSTRLLDQFIAHISVERGLARATVRAYESDLRRYLSWASAHTRGITDPDAIGKADIEEYVAQLDSDGDSARSKARRLASIHEFHRFALAQHAGERRRVRHGQGTQERADAAGRADDRRGLPPARRDSRPARHRRGAGESWHRSVAGRRAAA